MSYALNDAATTAPPDVPNHTKGSSQISRHYPFLTLFSLGQYSLLSSSFYPHLFLMVPYLSPSPSPTPLPLPRVLGRGTSNSIYTATERSPISLSSACKIKCSRCSRSFRSFPLQIWYYQIVVPYRWSFGPSS
jgi:hypothetical protein